MLGTHDLEFEHPTFRLRGERYDRWSHRRAHDGMDVVNTIVPAKKK